MAVLDGRFSDGDTIVVDVGGNGQLQMHRPLEGGLEVAGVAGVAGGRSGK
jgi:hypothetical protein